MCLPKRSLEFPLPDKTPAHEFWEIGWPRIAASLSLGLLSRVLGGMHYAQLASKGTFNPQILRKSLFFSGKSGAWMLRPGGS